MSFILDALKKSEAERQRQVGPTLLEVRITPPRRRLPPWALLVGVLLGLNMLLLLAYLLHNPAPGPRAGAVAGPAASPTTAAAATAAATPATVTAPATAAAAPAAPAAAVAARTAVQPGASALAPPVSAKSADGAGDAPADNRNPADEEPAVTPRRAGVKTARDGADAYAGWPSLSEVGGNLPDLRLDLHVYAERPSDRYALVNMHKVREGDVLPEGPRVIAITRAGVAMSYHGQDFMLRPQ